MTGLIAYKGNYAECLGTEGQKYSIRTATGKTLKVRAKDFRWLHPQFTVPICSLTPKLTDLALFSEEILTLAEVCEIVFDTYTPDAMWQTYELISDGVYGYFVKEKVCIRPVQHIQKILTKRTQDEAERAKFINFSEQVKHQQYTKLDKDILLVIADVAYVKLKTHKIFKFLDIASTPESAHQFLVEVGYWHKYYNPYPERLGIMTQKHHTWHMPDHMSQNVIDMTSLPAYAIDNADADDADDAISIIDGYIWVHIANVASVAPSELIDYARERISTMYLPDAIHRMLPTDITLQCALTGTIGALSIGCRLYEGELYDIKIQYSLIQVTSLTYAQADEMLTSQLAEFFSIAKQHQHYRKTMGAFTIDIPKINIRLNKHTSSTEDEYSWHLSEQVSTPARVMVAEYMIIAGRAVAQYASEHNIPMPYISQKPRANTSHHPKELSLSQKFSLIKTLPRVHTTTVAEQHSAMGLKSYLRVTSPLRRLLDLVAHIQLGRHLAGRQVLSVDDIQTYIKCMENMSVAVHKCQRLSAQWYKLLHISEQPKDLTYTGTVINTFAQKTLVFLHNYGLIVQVSGLWELDSILELRLITVDCYHLSSIWKVV